MRIIALKLKKETTVLLRDIARLHAKRDTGFVEDLYSMLRLKGKGIPTKDRIAKMCEVAAKKTKTMAMLLSFVANKRAILFQRIVKMPYFQAMCRVPNSISATERFLIQFTKLHNKVRQAQCMTCPLMNQCDFGKQYGDKFIDITYVIDPDYDKKAHPDCPELPQIGSMNQMAVATKQWEDMLAQSNTPMGNLANIPDEAKEIKAETEKLEKEPEPPADDDLDNCLDEEDFDNEDAIPRQATRTLGGGSGTDAGDFYGNIINVNEKMIGELNMAQLSIFELGRKFALGLQTTKKNKFKPTPKIDKRQKERQMESMSELSKVVPSEHALPDEVFDAKQDRKQLKVKQNLEQEKEKQLVYLLIDNSGSMNGQFPGANQLMCSRGTMASILAIAFCRHVLASDGIVFLRFFATSTTPLYEAKGKDDMTNIESILAKASYTGAGTEILRALKVAANDIASAKTKGLKLAGAELLLITDCEDGSVSASSLKSTMGDIPFSLLDVAGKGYDSPAMKAVAAKYYKANETELDVNKMVELL